MESIKRREALRRAAWIMGGVLAAPTISGILNGCTPRPELTWTPSFFSEEQARLIMQLAETILPETDSPGAKAMGVPGFIEEMISVVYPENWKVRFMSGMEAFAASCEAAAGSAFAELTADQQKEYARQIDTAVRQKKLEGDEGYFFRQVKELTLAGYYTTEYGATQALQYQAIPVEYHGCLPLEETGNGKVWATS